jgi:hypothetical protein
MKKADPTMTLKIINLAPPDNFTQEDILSFHPSVEDAADSEFCGVSEVLDSGVGGHSR